MTEPLLMTPGPTKVPDEVLKSLAKPVIHHRTKEFEEIAHRCSDHLKTIYQTKTQPLIIPGSGTAAMQAAITNSVNPGEKILCLKNGKFSDRFEDLGKAFGIEVQTLDFEWGTAVDPAQIKEALTDDIVAVTMAYNETSTGVRNPVAEVGKIVKNSNALFIVDTISCFAGDTVNVDGWNIDFCIAGSQKALAMTTGLAFITVSEKAWARMENSKQPKFYLDLKKYQKKFPQTPYSSPVSLYFGLDVALDLVEQEGIENRIKRHSENAAYCRKRVQELGFELFPVSEDICSNTLTAVKSDQSKEIKERLDKEFNIKIAGGQAELKGKIFRIGHMGVIGKEEIDETLGALEKVK